MIEYEKFVTEYLYAFVGDGCKLDCGSEVGSEVVLTARTHLKYNEFFDRERAETALRRPPEG